MDKYMEIAIKEAKKALKSDDVPVGAVVVENNKIIAKAHNTKQKKKQTTRHAEINVIEKACKKKKNWYLSDCEIYVTLEPCDMCLNAIKQAHIKKIYYAAKREKNVSRETSYYFQKEYQQQSSELLKKFFETKRK
ncbi:MAG: nucleoside deaminase [Bacilli bacterium]|nr:nucleoside deaminase [Bacilli bacterium]